MKQIQANADKMAICFSSLCIIHCLLLPIALIVIPTASIQFLADEVFHQALVVVVLLTSVSALFMGCKLHKNWKVMYYAVAGLLVLIFASIFGHDVLGEWAEKLLTVIGSLCVIYGHIQNYRLCKTARCDHT